MNAQSLPADLASRPLSQMSDPTGVPQLDLVLGGGLPRGSLIAVFGPPGSGKTTLVCQIAFAAASRGQHVLLLTALAETTHKLVQHLQGFRFYDPNLLGHNLQVFSMQQFLEQDVNTAIQEIVQAVSREQARLVIIDGFQVLRDLSASTAATRQQLYILGTRLSLQGITTLVTSEAAPRDPSLFPEMTTADGLIGLYYTLKGVRPLQSMEIVKMRGRVPLLGRHGLLLNEEGVQVFPRLEAIVRPATFEGWPTTPGGMIPQVRVPFELAELDNLLGGGLTRQT
ncbi:MAG: RAD55 family ATPase, partial [Ktedonobacteraceae bacterium]